MVSLLSTSLDYEESCGSGVDMVVMMRLILDT